MDGVAELGAGDDGRVGLDGRARRSDYQLTGIRKWLLCADAGSRQLEREEQNADNACGRSCCSMQFRRSAEREPLLPTSPSTQGRKDGCTAAVVSGDKRGIELFAELVSGILHHDLRQWQGQRRSRTCTRERAQECIARLRAMKGVSLPR